MKTTDKKKGIKNLITTISINPEHMLRKFSTLFKDGEVVINWSIISFTDKNLYWIERSSDGIDYSIIGHKEGRIKEAGEEILFSFTDNHPSEQFAYYRIKYGEAKASKKVLYQETKEGMYFSETVMLGS